MGVTAKREYILENLDCANCGAKIEREVGLLEGVENSVLDFVNKRLIVELQNEEDSERIYKETFRIVKKFEPDVEVIDKKKEAGKLTAKASEAEPKTFFQSNRNEIIRLMGGLVILVGTMLLKPGGYLELGLFIGSYLLVGTEVLVKAIKNIAGGQVFDENFLMALATIGAFAIGEYPEGVSVMVFYQIGEFFQDVAVHRSRKSISDLMNIKPDFANLVIGNSVQRVLPEEVMKDDIVIVKPGEKVPLDGVVVSGKSTIDTRALTGESVPRDIQVSDEILSGFINLSGLLKIRVTKEYGESTVNKILELVQNASSRKANTENFITKFARVYTPVVVISAVLLAIIPPLVVEGATFNDWIYRALTFLVVSCPCALVISIPLGYFGGIGGASKHGILIKGSNYLEALNDVSTVVFDKTGTLTEGIFEVMEVNVSDGTMTKEELLLFAAHAESYSTHPIATSVLKAYGKEVEKDQIQNIEELAGYGVKAEVCNKLVYIGNTRLMDQFGFRYAESETARAGTEVHIAIDDCYCGSIVIADRVRKNSAEAIRSLAQNRITRAVMLTGDNQRAAEAIASNLGIQEVYSELLPQHKVEKVELLEQQLSSKEKLIFVGDGINDAPVLARADIGIAMGGLGSDAAIEAADVVIMNDDPLKIVTAVKIARKTRSIIMQNIVFALGVKALVLAMGAAGAATLWEAVFADVGVALIAVLNSMRAMKVSD